MGKLKFKTTHRCVCVSTAAPKKFLRNEKIFSFLLERTLLAAGSPPGREQGATTFDRKKKKKNSIMQRTIQQYNPKA